MKKDLDYGLITKQIFIGIACGFFVSVLGLIIMAWLFGELEVSQIFFGIIFGYFGMLTGIGIVCYEFLKSKNSQKYFLKFFLQGLLGFIIGILGSYGIILLQEFMNGSKLLNTLLFISIITLPLISSILGFNYNINNLKNDSASHIEL